MRQFVERQGKQQDRKRYENLCEEVDVQESLTLTGLWALGRQSLEPEA
jgi:hypothetical protein